MKRIICAGEAFGYGTTTMLISIVRHLAGRASCAFVGKGIAMEMARRYEFDDYYEADTSTYEGTKTCATYLKSGDMVLCAINPHIMRVAGEADVPCVAADSLAWMWNAPNAPRTVLRYFVENFPGVEEQLQAFKADLPEYEVVGPIIDDRWASLDTERQQILVNFNGIASWLTPPPVQRAYVQSVWSAVRQALGDTHLPILVTGGAHGLQWIREMEPEHNEHLRLASLPPSAFLQELARSQIFITPAGLRAMGEGFTYGVPTVFLPPKCMSEELALQALRQAGVAPCSLRWSDLYALPELAGKDEDAGCEIVNQAILDFAQDKQGQATLAQSLRSFLNKPKELAHQQQPFIASMGQNGARRIAAFLSTHLHL